MTAPSKKRRAVQRGPGWLVTLFGVTVLICTGFAVGIVVGVVSQEPRLVAGHLMRPSESVVWSPDDRLPIPAAPDGTPGPGAASTAPAVAAAPPTAGRDGFAIQVGAFRDALTAEGVAEGLRAKGFPVYVAPAPSFGDGRWRVRVGPIANRAAADRLARRLKVEESLPTWVLSGS